MWSDEARKPSYGFEANIRVRFTNDLLGTIPRNEDILKDYIASKAPDAKTIDQEVAESGVDQITENATTGFPRGLFLKTADGLLLDPVYDPMVVAQLDNLQDTCEKVMLPFIWDYQWRGGFKEKIKFLSKASNKKSKAQQKKDEAAGIAEEKTKQYACAAISNYKQVVDGNWFVKQRRCPLYVPETYINDFGETVRTYDDKGNLPVLSRPLRADTMQGPRVSISRSELVPAGTECWFTIQLMNAKDKEAFIECMDMMANIGMLQWRSGGKGTLVWTPADANGNPIDIEL